MGLPNNPTVPPFEFALGAALIKIAVVLLAMVTAVPVSVWLERKVVADIQARIGPNRVGPFGFFQTFADGIKLVMKEAILPSTVDKLLYFIAPIVVMIPALSVMAVIPFAGDLSIPAGSFGLFGWRVSWPAHVHPMVIADLPVGFLLILSLTSLGVYGIVLAGWSSNNKYSLLGGLRSAAQMVSYELPMGLSIVAGVMILSVMAEQNGLTLSARQAVDVQGRSLLDWTVINWRVGVIPGLLAFLTYYICGLAETNRAPFDLPEAETELVGGYHTEYSGLKFAMFFLAEYAAMINIGAVAVTLFFGGWHAPYPDAGLFPYGSLPFMLQGLFWFVFKIFVIMVVYIWIRGTLPRLRYDRLMGFAWKRLVPLTLANVLLVATILSAAYQSPAPAALTAGLVNAPANAPGNTPGNAPSNAPANAPGNTPPHQQPGGLVPPNAPGNAPGNRPGNAPGSNAPSPNAPPAPAGNTPSAPSGNQPANTPASTGGR